MAEKEPLSKEAFLSIARASGLPTQDPHMEELYAYVKNLLPSLEIAAELDLGEAEPALSCIPSKE